MEEFEDLTWVSVLPGTLLGPGLAVVVFWEFVFVGFVFQRRGIGRALVGRWVDAGV
jgi:hypothetical protein